MNPAYWLDKDLAGQPVVPLQFVTDAGIGPALIRWYTWSEISHVDIVLPDGQLLGARDSAIRIVSPPHHPGDFQNRTAIPAGVQIRPSGYKRFTKVIHAALRCTAGEAEALYAAARSQIGKPYDGEAIFDFGIHDNDPAPTTDAKAWICSELVAWCALKAGVPIINPKVNYQRVTPEDLLKSPALRY